MKIKELVDEVKDKITAQDKVVSELKNDFSEFKAGFNEQLGSISKGNKEFLEEQKQVVAKLKELKQDLDNEITDFRLQRTQMQKKLFEKADDELKEHLNRIKTDVSTYNELKKQVQQISSTINDLSAEIKKFNEIARHLKTGDFELVKFAKQLQHLDNEKLELMRKIDSLERLISRMRRQR